MTDLTVSHRRIDVQPAEYQRLLGYPRDRVLEGRAQDLAAASRDWYDRHGSPWTYARQGEDLQIAGNVVRVEGMSFASSHLASMLTEAGASSVMLVAVSAGAELEQEAQRLWRDEKPDEYFFLETYGSAVVERLVTMKGAELCAEAEARGEAVLPHYSPGYPNWDVAQQPTLWELVCSNADASLPDKLEVLDSGMLRPKKSLLAVFGVTPHWERVRQLRSLSPCERCSFLPCQFRRAPYQETPRRFNSDELAQTTELISRLVPGMSPLDHDAQYSVNRKALSRWADTRLTLTQHDSGTFDAFFHFEGTTCSNLGRPLHFDYQVTLGPRDEGYVISALACRPAAGQDGYRSMCGYLKDADPLMAAIAREKPLLGEPLNRVLTWTPPHSVAGCHCEHSDRMHKWRLAFETIHFALVQRELTSDSNGDRIAHTS